MKFRLILSLITMLASFNVHASDRFKNVDLLQESLNLWRDYDTTSQEDSDSIVQKLHILTSQDHRVVGYDKARHVVMGDIYLEQVGNNYQLRDVYCQKAFSNSDFNGGSGIGPNKIPDNNILNVEHTWPQSRFTGRFSKEMQKSDLHHLFPSDSEMNSLRSNYKFAEIDNTKSAIKCPISSLGKLKNGYRFEPPNVHKGNVARALFYFTVRYKMQIDPDEEVFLRKWHTEDPVDEAERLHHEVIAKLQGNRNPFIDNPELVNQITNF